MVERGRKGGKPLIRKGKEGGEKVGNRKIFVSGAKDHGQLREYRWWLRLRRSKADILGGGGRGR